MGLTSNIKDKDWVSVRQAAAKLGSIKLGPTSTPTYAGLTLTGLTVNSLIYPVLADDGTSTGALTSLGAATDGQLPIGDTGGVPILANITQGSANQVRVANAAGSITLSTPQDIHTGASPTFAGTTITGCAVLGLNSAVFQPTTDSTTFFQVLDADGGTPILNVDSTNERIGIGTNAPDSVFHIKANTPGTVGSHPAGQLIIQDPDDTVFGNAVITGYESDGAGNPDQQLWYLGSSSSSNSEIIFLNRRNSKLHLGTNGLVRMTVESGAGSGHVGIGTTSPKTKLTIEGTLTLKEQAAADGDTATYGQVWCKDDVPNTLWFVNDLGTEIRIAPQDLQTSASPTFAGLTIVNAINEFSTDGTMGGDSDSAIPTEKATKLYTDTLRSDLASTANAKGASLVGVEDSAAQFDAADVEAALSELMVLVTPVEYNPAMSRTAGGDAGGDDNSVATIDDADSYDTDEVSATPGFDIQAVFSGVTDFNQVQIHTAYDGNPAHVVRIDLDKTPFDWSSYDTILADIDDNSGNFIFKAITVASAASYINSGEVRLRFYHSSAGNATHDFFIDYCALWKTGVSTGVTEHGGLTGLDDVSDHPSYLLLDGSRALVGAWDMGSQILTNVNIDSGDINVAVTNTEWDTAYSHSQLASGNPHSVTPTELSLVIGTNTQAWDASLDSIAALTYVSDSFIKVIAEDTYAIRTIAETKTDLSLNLVENTALSTWVGTASITTLGTIGTGTWQSTDVGIAYGGTGQSTAQLAINALSAVSGATNEHVLTKDTGTGNAIWKVATGGTDVKVGVDSGATADYLGAASSDGSLRVSGGLSYTDGGNFVTLGCNNPVGGTDTSAYEFTATNFTRDGSWYELDCSGTAPAGATTIIFCVTVSGNATNLKFQMRDPSFSDIYNNNRVRTQQNAVAVDCTMIVPCDTNRKVEYIASAGLSIVNVNIVGWFLG